MTHPNARKGAAWERSVRTFLADVFGTWRVRRPHQEGYRDVGDLHVEPGFVLQCKDVAALNVTGWLADVETQRQNARAEYGAVVWKRRQRGVRDGVVFMDLSTFRELLARLQPPAPASDEDTPSPSWLHN